MQVTGLLAVALASLQPISLSRLQAALQALEVRTTLQGRDLQERCSLVQDWLLTRQDGTLMFGHPTLRDWLAR